MAPTAVRQEDEQKNNVHPFVMWLNKSTKWVVSIGTVAAIFLEPTSMYGPYIGVGGILSVYLTDVLKQLIHQGRPNGAPFADPGMPSTHSFVTFFLAASWRLVYPSATVDVTLFLLAFCITALRVVCGYHTLAQVGVGAVTGCITGHLWTCLGDVLQGKVGGAIVRDVSWGGFVVVALVFCDKNVKKWLNEEKDL